MTGLPIAAFVTLLYGILSIIGGAIGYKQAGSQVSLISGFVSGLLLLIGAYLLFGGAALGPLLSAVVSLLLLIVFIVRLVKTRKFMPAGLMIIVGVINLATLWLTVPVN
ncbi:TMEM14 family protein [Leptolyngbya sp. BC1307]|uniref:TMEM14 family protein n=1 Tax=Leptolyngbya sp. BC1307 TaxID=2029589 RepID=UPI000EFC4921|nr:TMEM14 family protein [Leptolyngbya sp. BC1307]